MSQVEMHPFEAVLRMCADAAPNAWHPERYARRGGVPLGQVNDVLKRLWDAGLLEKAPRHPEDGPGVRLSAKGWEVLNDRQALRRLCANNGFVGAAAPRDRRAEAVLEPLRAERTAYVTWLLLGANVAVFLVGLGLAYRDRADVALTYLGGTKTLLVSALFLGLFVAFNVRAIARYLTGMLRLVILLILLVVLYKGNLLLFPNAGAEAEIRHQCGSLNALDWLRGEWWRALTACFVHLGLLHLLTNLMVLYNAGRFIENLWGPARYLVIYLLAGVTSCVAGLAVNPGGIAGASGALCGLIAALAVWMVFNGGYLPERPRRELWSNLATNLLLLVAISYVPGVSNWGHAGGALAGAAAAVCLHYQRFGPPAWRWAALLGLPLIPLAGLHLMDRERHHQKRWAAEEDKDFRQGYKHAVDEPLTGEMSAAFTEKVRSALKKHAEQRGEDETASALAVLEEQRKELGSWLTRLQGLGPYASKEASEKRQAALDALKERIDLYARAEECLRQGERFPARDEQELMDRIAATPELRRPEDKQRADANKRREQEDAARVGERPPDRLEGEREKFKEAVVPAVRASLETAHKLYHSDIAKEIYRDPAERVPQTVERVLGLIDKSRRQLDDLEGPLAKYKSSKDEEVRAAARRSQSYAARLAGVLDRAKRALDAGKRWTEEEKTETEDDLQKFREAWQDALEALGD